MTLHATPHEPIEILLVEDSPGDVRLTREALREAKVANVLHVVSDGEAAIALLRGARGRPRLIPDLILLDLNLPKVDGREVLAAIKSDDALRGIPVVVLTTSDADTDVLRAYDLHCNCYLVKPVNVTRFFDLIRNFDNFWLSVVRLPKHSQEAANA